MDRKSSIMGGQKILYVHTKLVFLNGIDKFESESKQTNKENERVRKREKEKGLAKL